MACTALSMSTVSSPLLSVMTRSEINLQPWEKSTICKLRANSRPSASVANSPRRGRLGMTGFVR